MRKGDLVIFKNLNSEWGNIGLITKIHVSKSGTGQIHLVTGCSMSCSIPWVSREKYIERVL